MKKFSYVDRSQFTISFTVFVFHLPRLRATDARAAASKFFAPEQRAERQ